MELEAAITGRRSVRKYKKDPIEPEVLKKVMDLAQCAPSAMNRRDYRFVVVQGQKKEELLKITSQAFLALKPSLEKLFSGKLIMIEITKTFFETYGGAPVIVLAYGGKFPDGREDLQSISLAVENLFLAAYEVGLGTVWTDGPVAVAEKEINALSGVDNRKLVSIIPLGYPDESPKAPPRGEDRVIWLA
jgi:nitroreductase